MYFNFVPTNEPMVNSKWVEADSAWDAPKVEEIPRKNTLKRGKEKKVSRRDSNFTNKEDVVICSAWLNVSTYADISKCVEFVSVNIISLCEYNNLFVTPQGATKARLASTRGCMHTLWTWSKPIRRSHLGFGYTPKKTSGTSCGRGCSTREASGGIRVTLGQWRRRRHHIRRRWHSWGNRRGSSRWRGRCCQTIVDEVCSRFATLQNAL